MLQINDTELLEIHFLAVTIQAALKTYSRCKNNDLHYTKCWGLLTSLTISTLLNECCTMEDSDHDNVQSIINFSEVTHSDMLH